MTNDVIDWVNDVAARLKALENGDGLEHLATKDELQALENRLANNLGHLERKPVEKPFPIDAQQLKHAAWMVRKFRRNDTVSFSADYLLAIIKLAQDALAVEEAVCDDGEGTLVERVQARMEDLWATVDRANEAEADREHLLKATLEEREKYELTRGLLAKAGARANKFEAEVGDLRNQLANLTQSWRDAEDRLKQAEELCRAVRNQAGSLRNSSIRDALEVWLEASGKGVL